MIESSRGFPMGYIGFAMHFMSRVTSGAGITDGIFLVLGVLVNTLELGKLQFPTPLRLE